MAGPAVLNRKRESPVMTALRDFAFLVGRIFMAAIFIYDSVLIAQAPAGNQAYMESFGVPGFLLWPTALFQFVGGVFLILGFLSRPTALAFAGFCILTALIFHANFGDVMEAIQFGKDFGLAGGFLLLTAAGAGGWSLDARLGTDGWPFSRS
jgi:putative oxidoreductase